MNRGRFTGRVVLVTGGGSGIGRAIALAFAGEGATVVVGGRNPARLAETAELVRRAGGAADQLVTDATVAGSVAALVSTTVERHGRLDVAVNNAGVRAPYAAIADIEEDDWRRVVDTNLTGVWLSMKYQIRHMRQHGGGVIVNVASNLGAHLRSPGMAAYAATKAAVAALTRTAAREYVSDGIRICALSPGVTATDLSLWPGQTDADRDAWAEQFIPIGRVAAPAEMAAVALWLASDECRFGIGLDLVIDGGASA